MKLRAIVIMLGTMAILAMPSAISAQIGNKPVQKRLAAPGEIPSVVDGFDVRLFTKNLGDIRALAVVPSGLHLGDVFVADFKRGKVVRLRDRGRDGEMDIKATYLRGFDRPSGLIASETTLYIADAKGLWSSPISKGLAGGQKTLLADLSKVQTDTDHRPLTLSADGQTVYIGLGAVGDAPLPAGSIVTVDTLTGRAALFAGGVTHSKALGLSASGRLFGLAEQTRDYDYFTQFSQGVDDAAASPLLQLPLSRSPTDFVMPWDTARIKNWPLALKNYALISFGGQVHQIDAVDLADVSFGSAKSEPQVLVSGFGDSRSAWGRPSAMAVDAAAGLLIADSWSGSVWRLTGKEPAPETNEGAELALSEEGPDIQDVETDIETKAEEIDVNDEKNSPQKFIRTSPL